MLPFPHEKEIPLCDFSSFKIGGPARYFAEAKTKQEMQEMLSFCHTHSLPFFVLGKGSNTLFDDRGFNGLVILNRIDYLHASENIFRVGSGYSFARLGLQTAREGWTGLEFAAGIPATCGGAVYMNAGASGQETKDTIKEVLYITEFGKEVLYKNEDLEWGYRISSFQKLKGAIVESVFSLVRSETAKSEQRKKLDYRLKTQPYKDPSVGCIFRNPFPDKAAAFLIDNCGLKGMKMGGASVSTLHANFIVNRDGAKAKDVLDLVESVKEQVFEKTGITLEEEVLFIPYE